MFSREDTILAYASSKAAVSMPTIQYANAFKRTETHSRIEINTATPGFIATDLNGFKGTRTVPAGVRIVIELATLDDDGPRAKPLQPSLASSAVLLRATSHNA